VFATPTRDGLVFVQMFSDDHLEHRLVPQTPFRRFSSQLRDEILLQKNGRWLCADAENSGRIAAPNVIAEVSAFELS